MRWLAGLTVLATGCAGLPAPLAPVHPPPHSAIELEEYIRDDRRPPFPYAEDARLRTPQGDTLRGRTAIQNYLAAAPGAPLHGFTFLTHRVYRCGAEAGIETGAYRAQRGHGAYVVGVAGRWYAEWRGQAGGPWAIHEALLLGPGEPLPAIDDACTDVEAERRAGTRLTASVQGAPFAFFTAYPSGGQRYITDPTADEGVERSGIILSATYRVGPWLTLGGVWGREPGLLSRHRLSAASFDAEWLRSRGHFVAATVGYEGRNINVEGGPAWLRSDWEWQRTLEGVNAGSVRLSTPGLVMTARAYRRLAADLGVEVMVQRRFFGREVVARGDPAFDYSRSGWFLGLGLALRTAL